MTQLERRKLSIQKIKARLPACLSLVDDTYINSRIKCAWIDLEYGIFWANARNVIHNNSGHPKRGLDTLSKKFMAPIQDIVAALSDGIQIKSETYIGKKKKAIFIDSDYGEWAAVVADVLNGQKHPVGRVARIAKTSLERYGATTFMNSQEGQNSIKKNNLLKYGVEHVSQNREISRRQRAAQRHVFQKVHWESREIIACTGSYESKVIDYLNTHKIAYDWEPRGFAMPSGRIYFPDFYLKREDKWIEIKGYFMQEISKEKWDWFHSEYPNSELWNKNKLKELKIL